MSHAFAHAEPPGPMQDALALAALARDCVASGVERRALHLRLSLLPREFGEPRHRRLLRETMAPLLRPTRSRLYELPGGDLVALAPPPGEHMLEVREALAQLMPDVPPDTLMPVLRLPGEAAALLAAVETALGLAMGPLPPPTPELPPAEPASVEAALRSLATANVASHVRRQPICHLAPGEQEAVAASQEIRVDTASLASLLLPGVEPGPRFRRAAERRMLAGLARPEEVRLLGPFCLPLDLATLEEPEFLRLEALLGPLGRRMLSVCVPLADALKAPGGFALMRRGAAARGWTLGLDGLTAEALLAVPLGRLGLPLLRLRFDAALLRTDAAGRAALDAALPADRASLILTGANTPSAVAWAWQRDVTRFMGRLMRG
jgi:hypothetical protein